MNTYLFGFRECIYHIDPGVGDLFNSLLQKRFVFCFSGDNDLEAKEDNLQIHNYIPYLHTTAGQRRHKERTDLHPLSCLYRVSQKEVLPTSCIVFD